jgi:hypothetical protein
MRANNTVEVVRKAVKGYEGYYEVDQFGRVYSVDRLVPVDDNGRQYNKALCGKQMKQGMHSNGYKIVSLTKEGKTKTVFVHRIVAEAFISNENNSPMVNHKDEDKTNNFVENLEWCTAKYNRSYGKAIEKHAKKIKGRKHTEEHKQKIAAGVKRSYGERKRKMRDRFTERLANGGVGYSNGEYFRVCYPWNDHCLTDIDRIAIKLCDIEDKIEQGKIVEMPCKVGILYILHIGIGEHT